MHLSLIFVNFHNISKAVWKLTVISFIIIIIIIVIKYIIILFYEYYCFKALLFIY